MGEPIGISETVAALRAELSEAARAASDEQLTFEVGQVQIEFHVGVKREAKAKTGVRFWVVELGAEAALAREQVQKVTVTLKAYGPDGESVRVNKFDGEKY